MMGAVPRGGLMRNDPRPQEGEDHYTIARHGFAIYSRELSEKEIYNFDLGYVVDGSNRENLAASVAGELTENADTILDFVKKEPEYIYEIFAETAQKVFSKHYQIQVSVGNLKKFSDVVLAKLVQNS
jgi:hypothetical protein